MFYSVNSLKVNVVFVTTPPVNKTARNLAIKLELNDGSSIHSIRMFEYRSNPVFTGIRPRNHLIV